MRISLNIDWEKPKWWYKIFTCKHEVALVEENFDSRYGCRTSYIMCLKCGRKAEEISRNCKHEVDCFGVCKYCKSRIEKFNCEHSWTREPGTDDFYCENCGVWKDEENVEL
jgi:hypothetical protein